MQFKMTCRKDNLFKSSLNRQDCSDREAYSRESVSRSTGSWKEIVRMELSSY